MNLAEAGYLLDVNVLVALILSGHRDHGVVTRWLAGIGEVAWGTCVLTEAALLKVMTNPQAGGQTMEVSRETLAIIARHPSHRFWPITQSCNSLTAPLAEHLFGHKQLIDAMVLGLAVSQNGVLVTMDRGMLHLAGARYRHNLLLLEA